MLSLESLAQLVGAELYQPSSFDSQKIVSGAAPLESAKEGELSFFADLKYKDLLFETKAAAVILKDPVEELKIPQLLHPSPRLAMALICQKMYQKKHSYSGISEQAYIHPEAQVHESVTLYPFAFVDKGVVIGKNTVVYSGVHLGQNCKVGEDCVLYANAILMDETVLGNHVIIHGGAVLGGDGFGFVPTRDDNVKVPQLGNVVVEDQVEIGPLCTIDRATFDRTIIRKGSKFDSQVHVGHNADIGELSLVCAQVAFGGCAKVGKRFIAAGQSAIGQAVTLPDNVTFGPKAGAMQDETESGEYLGTPLSKKGDWIRQKMALKKLPKLQRDFQRLLKRVEALEEG